MTSWTEKLTIKPLNQNFNTMKKTRLIIVISFVLIRCGPGNNSSQGNQTTYGSKPAYGIDISKCQGSIVDVLNRKTDSLDFIICKATEGITGIDSLFSLNRNMISAKGFICGCYHFYHCEDSITEQADNYINTAGPFVKTDLPPIVDFEETSISGNCSKVSIQSGLLNFLSVLQQRIGRRPIIYTDNNTADIYLNDSLFSDYALWIANPSEAKSPVMPSVWKSKGWTIWQKSWKYAAAMKDTSDFDVFNGDRKALNNFIQNN